MKTIVCGNGYFGSIYAERVREHPDHTLVGIVDNDLSKLPLGSGVAIATALSDLNGYVDYDAVIVCTPPETHLDMSTTALRLGRRVLCAKPGAMNSSDAEYLLDLAKDNDTTFSVDYTMLNAPECNHLDQLFSTYGEPSFLTTNRFVVTPPVSTSIIWDLVCHDVALYHHMMPMLGADVTGVVAKRWNNGDISCELYAEDAHTARLRAGYGDSSYEDSRVMKRADFNIKPYDVFKSPVIGALWDQDRRGVEVQANHDNFYIDFKDKPDPITLALTRLANPRPDCHYSYNNSDLFVKTTRVLAALEDSLTKGGGRVMVER